MAWPTCDCGECLKCKHREYMRAWYRRPGNAEAQRQSQARSRLRRIEETRAYDRARGHRSYGVEKDRARKRVRTALENGTLIRQVCEVCGDPKTGAHHDDYSQPLIVRWLCRGHHMELHRKVA